MIWTKQASPTARALVAGALLVAPADPEATSFPAGANGFAPMPMLELPRPAMVVASRDPFVSAERAAAFAQASGAELRDLGVGGHMNSASGHGHGDQGYAFVDRLRRKVAGRDR